MRAQNLLHRGGEPPPFGRTITQRQTPPITELIQPPLPAGNNSPPALQQTIGLQPMQRRIHSAFRQIEMPAAAIAQPLHHRIAMDRTLAHDSQQESIEMSFERFARHTQQD